MAIQVVNSIASLCFGVLYLEILKQLTQEKLKIKNQIVFALITWFLNTVCILYYSGQPLIKMLLIFIGYIIISKVCFNQLKMSNIILTSIIHFSCGFIADFLGYYLVTWLNLTVIDVQSTIYLLLITNGNYMLILVLVIMFIKKLKNRYKKLDDDSSITAWNKYLLFALILLTINIYLISMYEVSREQIEKLIWVVPLSIFLMVIYATYSRILMRAKEHQNEQLQFYLDTMTKLTNDIKRFKHDFKNLVIVLNGLAIYEEWDKLKDILIELQGSDIIKYSGDIDAMSNIREPSLIAVLAAKMFDAYQCGIQFTLEAPQLIEALPIEDIDFVRIIGILIDNALEAAHKSKERLVVVVLLVFDDYFEVSIQNSIDDENINVAALGEQGFSTRGVGRGLGLNNVTYLLEKYNVTDWSTVIEDGKFIQYVGFEISDLKEKELDQSPTQ